MRRTFSLLRVHLVLVGNYPLLSRASFIPVKSDLITPTPSLQDKVQGPQQGSQKPSLSNLTVPELPPRGMSTHPTNSTICLMTPPGLCPPRFWPLEPRTPSSDPPGPPPQGQHPRCIFSSHTGGHNSNMPSTMHSNGNTR